MAYARNLSAGRYVVTVDLCEEMAVENIELCERCHLSDGAQSMYNFQLRRWI